MELEVKQKKKWQSRREGASTVTGFLSFLLALIALAGLNVSLLLKSDEFPDFSLIKLPIIGLILGLVGLFTQKRSRLYAAWGIFLCLFLFIFTFLMFGLSWIINPKP
ncbi:hypothetical protein KHA94_05495 [Bacillus sp. FJAT-49705]|uniref:DUF3953 domain-containing protein n=1 Tax=Cytobacillus citreus TaxID=2833586 RepID=A0ABS5NPD8_9BACI|nr:hypothetical protein [Cytobacillus citreus]MBS4189665.1 hypothetical protein [Cytobacillus citreus]